MNLDKEFADLLKGAESEKPGDETLTRDDGTSQAYTNTRSTIHDTSGNPVKMTFYLILQYPDYSTSCTSVMGGEDVSLLGYQGCSLWRTPNGDVRAKDIWDVRPTEGQGPFTLQTPWNSKVLIIDAPPDLQVAKVFGWDGTAWLTDLGRAHHVQAPVPIERTIDDEWSF